MRINFDRETDALTLILSDETPAMTIDAGEGRFIDVDAEGSVLALEVVGVGLERLREAGETLAELLLAEANYDADPVKHGAVKRWRAVLSDSAPETDAEKETL